MIDANKILKRRNNAKVFSEIKEETKPSLDINRLTRRRNKAKGDLDQWRTMLQTAYHYALPDYNPFENYGRGGAVAQGNQYNGDIYDLTLPIAHQQLADKMLMGLVPQGQQWMKFMPGDQFGEPESAEYEEALEATQNMTDHFFKILDRSNFYTSVGESLSDVLISTGVIAVNEGTRKDPLKFESVPVSHVMFEGNSEGGVDAVFRDWMDVRVETITNMWPGAKTPAGKDIDDKVNIWECAFIDYSADDKDRYKYVVMTTAKEILLEQSNPSWPWVIYRMRKLTGETRGRGPSLRAYPTAATINQAMEDELIAAAFKANPMYMAASDSAFNQDTFEAKPGAIIPVQMIMGQWPIQGFPASGDINFSSLVINDLRQQINQMMFAFPLGPINAPDRTATEAQIRYKENLEGFAAMVPRLQNEFFAPIIKRSMWIINKLQPETFSNIEPSIREKMLSLDGEILGMSYETPLMTAKGQIKTDNLLGFYQALASMVGPEAATASLRTPDLVQALARNQDVEMANIKSKEELEQMMQEAGAAATQQAENEGIIPDE